MADDIAERVRSRLQRSSGASKVGERVRERLDRAKARRFGIDPDNLDAPKSTFGQIADITKGLPRGLAGFAKDVGVTTLAPFRIGYEALPGGPQIQRGNYERYVPALSKMGASMRHTGGRLVQGAASLAPGGLKPSETEYGKAVREGRIVGAALEDVGNVALVGAVASAGTSVAAGRAAGAAARAAEAAAANPADEVLARAATQTAERAASRAAMAQRVGRITDYANRAADVPIRPYRGAFRILKGEGTVPRIFGEGVRPIPGAPQAVEWAAARNDAAARALEGVRSWRAGRAESRYLRDNYLIPAVQERQRGGRALEFATKRAEKVLRDPEAQYANHLYRAGVIEPARTALRLVGHEGYDQFVRDVWGIEHAPSERTLRLVDDLASGRLSPAEREAFDVAWEATDRMNRALEQRKLEGFGRQFPMSEEQLGREAMPTAVERRLAPLRRRLTDVEEELYGSPLDPEDFGLRGEAAAARARVPQVEAETLVSGRAQARARAAGGAAREAELARAQAQTAAEAADAARARGEALAEDVRLRPPDLEADRRLFAGVEQQAARTTAAEQAARAADEAALGARQGTYRGAANAELARHPELVNAEAAPVTPEQVRAELAAHDADVAPRLERALEGAVADIEAEFPGLGESRLTYKPPPRFARSGVERMAGDRIDTAGGEWDWFAQLPKDEQARIRARWMGKPNERGVTPDELGTLWRRSQGQESLAQQAEVTPTSEYARLTRRVDDLEAVKAGKATREQIDRVAPELEAVGVDVERLKAATPARPRGRLGSRQVAALREESFAEHLRQQAEAAARGPEPPFPGPGGTPVWQMSRQEFETFATETWSVLDAAHERIAAAGDDWATFTPEEEAVARRWAQHVGDFDAPGGAELEYPTFDALYDRIGEAARRHGLIEGEGPIFTPTPTGESAAAAGMGAVRSAEQRAAEALAFDQELPKAAKAAGRTVADYASDLGGYEYARLSAEEKELYRQLRQQERRGQAVGALEDARIRARGRIERAARGEGRRIGGAEAEARIFERQARQGAQRAETVEGRLPDLEARAQAAAAADVQRGVRAGTRAGRFEERAVQLERRLAKRQKYASWLDDHIGEQEQRLLAGPKEVAPGAYRTPLLANERAQQSLAEMAKSLEDEVGPGAGDYLLDWAGDLSHTIEQLHEQGILPEYLPGGVTERVASATRIPGRNPRLPFIAKTAGERLKREGSVPMTTRAVGRIHVEEFSRMVENDTASRIAADRAVTTPAGDFLAQARQQAEAAGDTTLMAELDHLRDNGGHDLAKFMERHELSAWDPEHPTGTVASQSVNADTLFIPTKLKNEYQSWFRPKDGPALVRAYDGLTRGWKHLVLAANPHWHIGNVFGNMLLATVGGGLTPAELVRYGLEARRLLKQEALTGESLLPARLYGAGMGGEMLRYFSGTIEEGNRLSRALEGRGMERLAHPLQTSYDLNSWVDDWGRSTVYLAKRAKGLAEEDAVKASLKAMGDFSNLSPFERNVARRVIPFYAWLRHVTQLAFHLGVEHPVRTAWVLQLAHTFGGDDEAGMPGWLSGAIPLGGDKYLNLASLNPYGNVFETPILSPADALRSLNPVIKTVGAAANINVGKGQLMSRPTGTGPLNDLGQPKVGWIGGREFLHYLGQQTPQGRLFKAVREEPVVRYDTGDPVLRSGETIPLPGGRGEQILRNVGVPAPQTFVRDEYAARAAKGREAARKAREKRARIFSSR